MSATTRIPRSPSGKMGLVVGRYELAAELARGGMATVYLARLRGDGGLQRIVAVKRMHAHIRDNDDLEVQFLDEARLALRVRHPNVLHALDVVLHEGELLIVMEYIEGASMSQLMRLADKQGTAPSLSLVSGIMVQALHGLHAAHEARGTFGEALNIVHRDISPHNLLVGSDGVTRVVDFGVAKAAGQSHITRSGVIQGKLAYLSPEQLLARPVDRRADVFAAGIVLWEMLTSHRLFFGTGDGQIVLAVLESNIPAPSTLNPLVTSDLDAVVLRALNRSPEARYPTAQAMAEALARVITPATTQEIGAWVRLVAAEVIANHADLVAEVESTPFWSESSAEAAPAPPPPTSRRVGSSVATLAGAVIVAGLGYGAHGWLGSAPPRSEGSSAPLPAVASVGPMSAAAPVDAGAASGAMTAALVSASSAAAEAAAPPAKPAARAGHTPGATRHATPATATKPPPLYSRD